MFQTFSFDKSYNQRIYGWITKFKKRIGFWYFRKKYSTVCKTKDPTSYSSSSNWKTTQLSIRDHWEEIHFQEPVPLSCPTVKYSGDRKRTERIVSKSWGKNLPFWRRGLFLYLRGMDTLSGDVTQSELLLPPFWKGVYYKRKAFAPKGSKCFPFIVNPYFRRTLFCRKAKVVSLVKMVKKKLSSASIPLNCRSFKSSQKKSFLAFPPKNKKPCRHSLLSLVCCSANRTKLIA